MGTEYFDMNTALTLEPLYSPNLIKCFNEFILTNPKAYEIAAEKIDSKLTLATLAHHELNILLDKDDLEQLRRKWKEKRRLTKLAWYKPLKNELEGKAGPRSKNPIREEIESSIRLARLKQNIEPDESAIHEEIFADINKWKESSDAPLVAFRYFPYKAVRYRVTAFINDLILETIFLIKSEYNGKIDGAVTNYPNAMIDFANINFNNSKAEFKAEVLLEDEIKYELDLNIPQGLFHAEYSPPKTETQEIIEKNSYPIENGGVRVVTIKKPLLNTKHSDIIATIFTGIKLDSLDNHILITGRSLAEKVYNTPNPRPDQIKDVVKCTKFLRNWEMSLMVEDNGILKRDTFLRYIQFLDIVYDDNGENPVLDIVPSDNMINAYISKNYTGILSKTLNQIPSSKTRSIALILQRIRVRLHQTNPKKMDIWLTEYNFRERMLFYNMKPFQIRKQLNMIFLELCKYEGLIEEYKMVDKRFYMRFTPIDEYENNILQLSEINFQNILIEDQSL